MCSFCERHECTGPPLAASVGSSLAPAQPHLDDQVLVCQLSPQHRANLHLVPCQPVNRVDGINIALEQREALGSAGAPAQLAGLIARQEGQEAVELALRHV